MDVVILGILENYVDQTLVGMGALKGAPCTVKSVESALGVHTITLEWTDNDGEKHTQSLEVTDGTNGTNGTDGVDGVSPTITVKASTDDTYILTITDKEGSFDTPNLKGGGSGGASSMADLTDVDLTDLAVGDVLIYSEDDGVGKWIVTRPLTSISVNGVAQTITAGAVDLDVASNLITETQWTAIENLFD